MLNLRTFRKPFGAFYNTKSLRFMCTNENNKNADKINETSSKSVDSTTDDTASNTNNELVTIQQLSVDENELKERTKVQHNEALEKLKQLLSTITQQDVVKNKSKPTLDLARPISRRRDPHLTEFKKNEMKLRNAAKDVAALYQEDSNNIESELLAKLMTTMNSSEKARLSPGDIVKDMAVDRGKNPEQISRAEQVRQMLNFKRKIKPWRMSMHVNADLERTKIDLFSGPRLNIFTNTHGWTSGPKNRVWDLLHEKELKLAIRQHPRNYFEHMIQWTEEGKIWHFPIDNEQGWDSERDVSFVDHVFLQKHVKPWCPQRGPIRHYMDIMCVGLSKNPYMTVQMKIDQILWHKKYFGSKKKLLLNIGAITQEEAAILAKRLPNTPPSIDTQQS